MTTVIMQTTIDILALMDSVQLSQATGEDRWRVLREILEEQSAPENAQIDDALSDTGEAELARLRADNAVERGRYHRRDAPGAVGFVALIDGSLRIAGVVP